MTVAPGNFILFPHMAIREGDLRSLSVFLPRLSILQAVDPPRAPSWATPHILALPAGSLGDAIEKARRCIAGYKGLGELHGASGMLSAIVRDWAGNSAESRLGIQRFLKKGPEDLEDPGELSLLEAAVFLEMARLLDEEEIELDRNIFRARALEAEFREIVGSADEEETREELETLNVPLDIDRSHLSYMLRERMGHWLRLFATSAEQAPTALVAGNLEATREMLEAAIPPGSDPATFRPAVRQVSLASIPDPGNLPREAFEAFLAELERRGILESAQTTLGLHLRDPAAEAIEETLKERTASLESEAASLAASWDGGGDPVPVELRCTLFLNLTWGDLWRFLDKKGLDTLGERAVLPLDALVPPLLHLARPGEVG